MRSVNEIMIHAMERFGESEPKNVIVLWQDSDDLNWCTNLDSASAKIGMLELCKHAIIQGTSDR